MIEGERKGLAQRNNLHGVLLVRAVQIHAEIAPELHSLIVALDSHAIHTRCTRTPGVAPNARRLVVGRGRDVVYAACSPPICPTPALPRAALYTLLRL